MSEYKKLKCDALRLDNVGEKVKISGWVETIRDLGGLVFLDIRDMYGITQVVTSGKDEDVDFASHIPVESAVSVYGTVKKREQLLLFAYEGCQKDKIIAKIIMGPALLHFFGKDSEVFIFQPVQKLADAAEVIIKSGTVDTGRCAEFSHTYLPEIFSSSRRMRAFSSLFMVCSTLLSGAGCFAIGTDLSFVIYYA